MEWPVYISRNGVLVAPAEARVSVLTPALYGAYGVYESMKVVGGVPFEEVGPFAPPGALGRDPRLAAAGRPGDIPALDR